MQRILLHPYSGLKVQVKACWNNTTASDMHWWVKKLVLENMPTISARMLASDGTAQYSAVPTPHQFQECSQVFPGKTIMFGCVHALGHF